MLEIAAVVADCWEQKTVADYVGNSDDQVADLSTFGCSYLRTADSLELDQMNCGLIA